MKQKFLNWVGTSVVAFGLFFVPPQFGTIHKEPVVNDSRFQEIRSEIQVTDAKPAVEAARAKAIEVAKPPVVAATGSCDEWIAAAGVTDTVNARELIRRESGCNPNAVNKSSGACGIPQALPCSKLGTSDPVQQIRWMDNYVKNRYGSWAAAVSFHNANNWY